ncbi:MAG: ankyrin repeat domain-containing protein [Burkholderiaceae bacterium]
MKRLISDGHGDYASINKLLEKSNFDEIKDQAGATFANETLKECLTLIEESSFTPHQKIKMALRLLAKLEKIQPFGSKEPYDVLISYATESLNKDQKYKLAVSKYFAKLRSRVDNNNFLRVRCLSGAEHVENNYMMSGGRETGNVSSVKKSEEDVLSKNYSRQLKDYFLSGQSLGGVNDLQLQQPDFLLSKIKAAFSGLESHIDCLPHYLVWNINPSDSQYETKLEERLVLLKKAGISFGEKIRPIKNDDLAVAAQSIEIDGFRSFLKNNEGDTLLHIAQKIVDQNTAEEATRFLITRKLTFDINIDALNKERKTALMCAIEKYSLKTIDLLIKSGADLMNVKMWDSYNAEWINAAQLIVRITSEFIPFHEKIKFLENLPEFRKTFVNSIKGRLAKAFENKDFDGLVGRIEILLNSTFPLNAKIHILKKTTLRKSSKQKPICFLKEIAHESIEKQDFSFLKRYLHAVVNSRLYDENLFSIEAGEAGEAGEAISSLKSAVRDVLFEVFEELDLPDEEKGKILLELEKSSPGRMEGEVKKRLVDAAEEK